VQIDPPEGTKDKPKRQGLPRGVAPSSIDLAAALKLLELPRDVGPHPETGKMITAGIGRFGPFVKHDTTYASIPKGEDVLTIGMNRAVDLITQKMLNPPKGRWGKKKAPASDAPTQAAAPTPKKKAAPKKKATKKTTTKKKPTS
jgi:DNA topoisomerase-1